MTTNGLASRLTSLSVAILYQTAFHSALFHTQSEAAQSAVPKDSILWLKLINKALRELSGSHAELFLYAAAQAIGKGKLLNLIEIESKTAKAELQRLARND